MHKVIPDLYIRKKFTMRFVNQSSSVSLRLIIMSGRTVLTAQQHAALSGKQTVAFPLGSVARGIYQCEIKAGQFKSQSTLLVQYKFFS